MNHYFGLLSLGVPELFVIPLVIAWLWALVDCLVDRNRNGGDKLVWTLALLLLNIFAAIAYWAVKFARRRSSTGAAG